MRMADRYGLLQDHSGGLRKSTHSRRFVLLPPSTSTHMHATCDRHGYRYCNRPDWPINIPEYLGTAKCIYEYLRITKNVRSDVLLSPAKPISLRIARTLHAKTYQRYELVH